MSAYIDDSSLHMIKKAGYMFFAKPFDLKMIDKWLAAQELNMDLSQPPEINEKEDRTQCKKELIYAMFPRVLS